jgi:protein TonB
MPNKQNNTHLLGEGRRDIETLGQSEIDRSRAKHLGLVLPMAAVVTTGLMLAMSALIAVEFVPQAEAETRVFDINPVESIIEPPLTVKPPQALQAVEVPPPPPRIQDAVTKKVEVAPRTLPGMVKPMDGFKIDLGDGPGPLIISDVDAKPLVRVPPAMPPRFAQGDHSGYCKVRFDVSAEGQPFNIDAYACTSGQLKSATVKSVQRWKYKPKMLSGQATSRSGVQATIRFDLTDERGQPLPLPSGSG